MPSFSNKRHVPFSAAQMYALVADVERYPEFLPMCSGLKILARKLAPAGEELTARMSVGYKAINESFTTRVVLDAALPRIDVTYLDGPFSHLENRWRFTDQPAGGSEIDFFITYQFKSVALGLLVGAVFDQAFRKFADAFVARAGTVYGGPKAPEAVSKL